MIGDQFQDADEICGLVFQQRKGDHRLQLWTKNARNKVAVFRIGEEIRKAVDTQANVAYVPHSTLDADCKAHAFPQDKEIKSGSS
jgi:translation initiation factor 4E